MTTGGVTRTVRVFASFADASLASRICARTLAAALALLVTLGPARAHADQAEPAAAAAEGSANEARALSLSDEGSALYDRGEYSRALEKFIAAYALGQDANLLFNMGRCYQRLGENAVAEEKYRAFIADPRADPAGVERARELLETLHEPAPSETPAALAAPASPERDRAPARRGSTVRAILPWVSLGASVASLTAGTTLYLMGVADHGRITDSRGYEDPNGISPLTEVRARDLVSSGETKKTLGAVGLGLGGALLVTSIVLFITSPGDEPPTNAAVEPSIGVAFAPGPRGGSLGLIGSF
jgi:hypothetical protein